jgi:hypothetical protein
LSLFAKYKFPEKTTYTVGRKLPHLTFEEKFLQQSTSFKIVPYSMKFKEKKLQQTDY